MPQCCYWKQPSGCINCHWLDIFMGCGQAGTTWLQNSWATQNKWNKSRACCAWYVWLLCICHRHRELSLICCRQGRCGLRSGVGALIVQGRWVQATIRWTPTQLCKLHVTSLASMVSKESRSSVVTWTHFSFLLMAMSSLGGNQIVHNLDSCSTTWQQWQTPTMLPIRSMCKHLSSLCRGWLAAIDILCSVNTHLAHPMKVSSALKLLLCSPMKVISHLSITSSLLVPFSSPLCH